MYNAIKQTHFKLINSTINVKFSGSTLLVLYIKDHRLFVLNVGDSRAVAGIKTLIKNWESEPLSKDHKPENPEEKQRILNAGGRIDKLKDHKGNECGPTRVWLSKENFYGISMSRSVGDSLVKNLGVIWEPGKK